MCVYSYKLSESLIRRLYFGFVFSFIHPLCAFWLEKLIHLYWITLLIGNDLPVPFCPLLSDSINLFFPLLVSSFVLRLFSLVVCFNSLFFNILCIYYRFLFFHYNEALIQYLIVTTGFFKLIKTDQIKSLYITTSPPTHILLFDVVS
jgi:hypothetical protein